MSPLSLSFLLDGHLRSDGNFEHLGGVQAHKESREHDDRPLESSDITNEGHQRVELALVLVLLVRDDEL